VLTKRELVLHDRAGESSKPDMELAHAHINFPLAILCRLHKRQHLHLCDLGRYPSERCFDIARVPVLTDGVACEVVFAETVSRVYHPCATRPLPAIVAFDFVLGEVGRREGSLGAGGGRRGR
jgi:hypothetical protein